MIFDVIFKTPDAFEQAKQELEFNKELTEEQRELEFDKLQKVIDRYTEYGELVCIKFDTDKISARVM